MTDAEIQKLADKEWHKDVPISFGTNPYYSMGFEACYKLLQQQPKEVEQNEWISVEDMLPELKKFKTYEEISIPIIVYDAVEDLVFTAHYSRALGFDDRNPDITHWHPLPAKPKK